MATNAPRSLQVFDPVLTGIARSYRPTGLIARQLLPTIPTAKLSAQYPVFTKEDWLRVPDNRVQDRAPAHEIDFTWSTETYLCEEYALKVGMTDLERDQAIDPLHFERSKTEFLTNAMELNHEIRVAALLRKVANGGSLNLGTTLVGAGQWDNAAQAATPTIEKDIRSGVLAVHDATAGNAIPNLMVIPFKVAYVMALDPAIRSLLRYDAAGKARDFIELGNRVLPSVIHGMQVKIVQGPMTDSSNPGGTSTVTEIWGKSVRLLYINPSAGWGIPAVAYNIVHTPKRVTRWRQTDPDIEYVREMERYDLKAVAPDAGYEIDAAIA